MFFSQPDRLPRPTKKRIVFGTDVTTVLACFVLACVLRFGSFTLDGSRFPLWLLAGVMALAGAGLVALFRLPQVKLQSFDSKNMTLLLRVSVGLAVVAWLLGEISDVTGAFGLAVIFGALFFGGATGWRLLALGLLSRMESRTSGQDRENVAIYGAGSAGIQLASALRQSAEVRPVLFFDDNPNLHGVVIAGVPVYPPARYAALLRRHRISKLLLAMPSVPQSRQNALIAQFSKNGIEVQVLPSYIDLMSGKGLEASLRPVKPDQLLGRDKVALDTPEIAKAYKGRVVMITGAGGSIGSELCRQLVDCEPGVIVLFEQGEFGLYSIDRELRAMAEDKGIKVVTRLGSVTNRTQVTRVVAEEGVEIILHAAAYKHVPIVEDNELEGARNNVLGTQIVADVAAQANINRFILVSTDKAVRPTNVMGATKRLAEMVVQDRQTRSKGTKFAMVRFGNVLGSSGSVLPLFQKQIDLGGPLTVTHPEITRFFMTIPEAARLVLLAGAYAEGGDVFVLDMGKPQKIFDIARKMIELSGRTVRDAANPDGDIEIHITGMRPGEKLYEELLIDTASQRKTPHPKIMRAQEAMLDQAQTDAMLQEVRDSIDSADEERLRALIAARVDGYRRTPNAGNPD